jgi:hypothetical protein
LRGWKEVAQIMYTHVSKCKNNKIKFKNKITKTKNFLLAVYLGETYFIAGMFTRLLETQA